jgi:hypothetical protein
MVWAKCALAAFLLAAYAQTHKRLKEYAASNH